LLRYIFSYFNPPAFLSTLNMHSVCNIGLICCSFIVIIIIIIVIVIRIFGYRQTNINQTCDENLSVIDCAGVLIRYELLCLFLKLNTEIQFETQLCDPRSSGNEWQTVPQLSVPSFVCKEGSCAWLGSVAS